MKITFYTLFISLLLVGCAKDDSSTTSQISDSDQCLVEVNGDFIDVVLEQDPEYLNGGVDGFNKAFFQTIRYPAEARENGIEGLCIISYEITTEGKVENIGIVQDPGGGIGNHTSLVIEEITEGISFRPAVFNGNSVRVRKGLEIRFRLEG